MPGYQVQLPTAFTDTTLTKLPKSWRPDFTIGGRVQSPSTGAGVTGTATKSSELTVLEQNVYYLARTGSTVATYYYWTSDGKPAAWATVPSGTPFQVVAYARAQLGAITSFAVGLCDTFNGGRHVFPSGDTTVTSNLTSTLTKYTFSGNTTNAWDTQTMRIQVNPQSVVPCEIDVAVSVLITL